MGQPSVGEPLPLYILYGCDDPPEPPEGAGGAGEEGGGAELGGAGALVLVVTTGGGAVGAGPGLVPGIPACALAIVQEPDSWWQTHSVPAETG